MRIKRAIPHFCSLLGLLGGLAPAWAGATPAEDLVRQGEYIFRLGGCQGCHTDSANQGAPLAGGRALETPFGTFYTPNITPDPIHGIGKWSEYDFVHAITQGMGSAAGQGIASGTGHYFPVFPYPAYTHISRGDLHALWIYLRTVPPAAHTNKRHDTAWYLLPGASWAWQLLFFKHGADPGQAAQPEQSAAQRGEYIAKALAHCEECHTPRTRFGTLDQGLSYAGTQQGPEGAVVPNITPDPKTGIGQWAQADLLDFFKDGGLPNGDYTGGLMAEVIDNGLKYLTREDAEALATYIRNLPPIEHAVSRKKKTAASPKP
ncbi:MAG: cytochrome C [Pseudomonadota bacterium]